MVTQYATRPRPYGSAPTKSIDTLFTRLQRAGIGRKFVRTHVLPDWWDDSIATTEAGYLEAAAIVARNLSLDLVCLCDDSVPIAYRDLGRARFKKRAGITSERMTWPKTIALRAAELACHALESPAGAIPNASSTIRDQILSVGNAHVTLPSLLDYCWSIGMPVIHVSTFPSNTAKMDAVTSVLGGRPAIAVSRSSSHDAWLMFLIAHEMGHIALGHLANEPILVDEHVRGRDSDPEEIAANRFAIEVLAGDPGLSCSAGARWPTAQQLSGLARVAGLEHRVDPGVLVLNFGWTNDLWPLANAALKILEPDADAPAVIRAKMEEWLCWDRLPAESAAFLRRITSCQSERD